MKLGSKPEIFVLEDLTWLSPLLVPFSVVLIYNVFNPKLCSSKSHPFLASPYFFVDSSSFFFAKIVMSIYITYN